MRRRVSIAVVCGLAAMATACSTPPSPPDGTGPDGWTLEITTPDISVNTTQRFEVILTQTTDTASRSVVYGSLHLAFSYLGSDGTSAPDPRGDATAGYLAVPGTPASGPGPAMSEPSAARGAYLADGVRFDAAGTWQASASADVRGAGHVVIGATFPVAASPSLPSPGDRAIPVDNPTTNSGLTASQIDSRATGGTRIPDPELHRWSVRDALAAHRPMLLLFSTPAYCQSRVCGPATEEMSALAETYADRAIFIHVEVWRNFTTAALSSGASTWLLHNGVLNEPWLYLIGADGTILDRWPPLVFDWAQVTAELARLPTSN